MILTVSPEAKAAADAADLGRATAMKRGRTAAYPYVPVIDHGSHTDQIRGFAFASQAEAVAYAERHLVCVRSKLAADLMMPNLRALREHHGLARELT